MKKRISALLLLLCTVFLLCACPGGGPVTPPADDDCTYCGGAGCDQCTPSVPPADDDCTYCGGAGCDQCTPSTPPADGICKNCDGIGCEQCMELGPPVEGITVSAEDANYSLLFGAGATLDGTGDSIASSSPVLTQKTFDESSAKKVTAARFFQKISFDGGVYRPDKDMLIPLRNTENDSYNGNGTVMILPLGLLIENCVDLTFKNMVIKGDVTILASNAVFENVQFLGKVTVKNGSEDVIFNSCRFNVLVNEGKDTAVLGSCFAFSGVGVQNKGKGLYVSNCRFEGTGTAISSVGDELDVRLSTIKTDRDGIGVEIKDSGNSVVSLSVITGAQKSILLNDVLNTAVVRNSLVSVEAKANKNIYICDNAMGGRIASENNNYFLADGNEYPADGKDHRTIISGNENVNGDNLTDVHARAEVGVNEELLPHVDKDLFVYMERKDTVKEVTADTESSVYAYIEQHAAKSKYVVVAPGVYTTTGPVNLNDDHSDTTIYAYGVYVEAVEYADRNYAEGHIRVNGAESIAFKGLSIGFAQQSNGQIYILEKQDNNTVLAVTGAGFWNEFCNSGSPFMTTTEFGLQRAGTFNGLGEYFVTSVKKNGDGTMTVKLREEAYEVVKKGDILTCRLGNSAAVVGTNSSKDILYQDFTMYGYASAFAFYEKENMGGVTYNRVLDTQRLGKVIDKATYDRYRAWEEFYGVDLEISIDTLPNGKTEYRGAPAHVSSIDGVHNGGSIKGSTVISSLFEGLCDDMANQKSTHARLSKYIKNDDGTVTLIYKGNITQGSYAWTTPESIYGGYCAPFRAGDRVYIYTPDGQLVCDGAAILDGVYYDTIKSTFDDSHLKNKGTKGMPIKRYAVTVSAECFNESALDGFDLSDDSYAATAEKVLVDNMSRASYGFHIDNVLVRNTEKSGVRAKASGGVVEHCTFRNLAKTATSMVYEIFWGESGIVRDYTFQNNLIDNTGYAGTYAKSIDDPADDYRYTPICIIGLGGYQLDREHMLFQNVVIEGNKFVNRYLGHYNAAIFVRAACNLTIKNNDFGTAADEDGTEKFAGVLYLDRVLNVKLSGNTYSPYVSGNYSLYVQGKNYKNIVGSDVVKDGVPQIPDKP